ncbi:MULTISPECIES: DUF2071 domain-containing protein [Microbacterium]|uniref:DUF2071 domain-containing protein n=1 Tax=Microbacterium TaxID=33882 RepID=UPI002783091D|nr:MULTISPECIES: DUF2071 domain-containing protein [Microbacterium]MDQ1083069.1 uncharacterized protein YqjF (DUF2071 family) [Microbacterium sp. SORGH_AS_0344]MDQ1171659.1 uncharacterized protein YqjF (DUF2071 family) [Microbacterium proteolyticum]
MTTELDRTVRATGAPRTPRMAAVITRRALVNYRVDPGIAQSLLPDGLHPQLINGSAVAGVCLIRLDSFRPAAIRPAIGLASRSTAHRIAVEWENATGRHTGVYIPRRHSASRLARAAGGRVFPGLYARASVTFRDTDGKIHARVDAEDLRVRMNARRGPGVAFHSELFTTLEESSEFFRKDPVGWSPSRSGALEGLRLDTDAWRVDPLEVTDLASSFFDALPRGSAVFDHAFLMRDVPARWSSPAEPSPVA